MKPAQIPPELLNKYNEEKERKRKEFNSAKLWDDSGNWIGTFISFPITTNFDDLDNNLKKQEKYMNASDFYLSCKKED